MKARNKLHQEIDLLHIIKQLRVSTFNAQCSLLPHQIMLVKWFEQYKIKLNEAPDYNRQQQPTLTPNDLNRMSRMYESIEEFGTVSQTTLLERNSEKPLNLLVTPKHVKLELHTSELDKIKDFDPISNKVDMLIMKQVFADNQIKMKQTIDMLRQQTLS